MSRSREPKMVNMPLGSTQWTGGFWGDRFKVFNTGRCGKWEKVNGFVYLKIKTEGVSWTYDTPSVFYPLFQDFMVFNMLIVGYTIKLK